MPDKTAERGPNWDCAAKRDIGNTDAVRVINHTRGLRDAVLPVWIGSPWHNLTINPLKISFDQLYFGFKVPVGRQFAKVQAGKLFRIVLEGKKEASVYHAAIYKRIIIKCQVKKAISNTAKSQSPFKIVAEWVQFLESNDGTRCLVNVEKIFNSVIFSIKCLPLIKMFWQRLQTVFNQLYQGQNQARHPQHVSD